MNGGGRKKEKVKKQERIIVSYLKFIRLGQSIKQLNTWVI
jgi:hypothetical protein